VQQKLEKERAARVDVQNELAAAEREWDKVSEQVKLKSDKALRQIRELETERIVLMENAASKESKISQLKSEVSSHFTNNFPLCLIAISILSDRVSASSSVSQRRSSDSKCPEEVGCGASAANERSLPGKRSTV